MRLGLDLDKSLVGELEGVGGEVEQHPAQGQRVPESLVVLERLEPDLEPLLLGYRLDDVLHRFEDLVHREGGRLVFHQLVSPPRQFYHVACNRTEPQRGRVDEAELAVLDLVERAALASLERLGEEEYGGQGRPQVMSHLDNQLEPARS